MRNVSYRSVQFVISIVLKKVTQKGLLDQFMRTKSHMCSICNFSFSLKARFKMHIESVNENKKSHKCSICDYFCSQKFDLKIHTESFHDNYKLQKCSICDFNSY